MIIKDLKYIKYKLPLLNPITTSKLSLVERTGFILRLEDSKGNISYGEAAPLDGFSSETLDEAENEIKNFCKEFHDFNVHFDPSGLEYKLENYDIKSPSFSLAFDQALLWLMFNSKNLSLKTLGIESIHEIKFNGFVDITSERNTLDKIERLLKKGFDTIKLKIGRAKFSDDLRIIKVINARLGDACKLRLDVNGKWSKDEAAENLGHLNEFNIEYVEQPCRKLSDLIFLKNNSPVQIAVDESIENIDQLNKIIDEGTFENIVVKPMRFGQFFELIKIINRAEKLGKNIILSSAFESNLGKLVLSFLSQYTKHEIRHGFATDDIFKNNILNSPFIFNSAKMIFTNKMLTPKLNLEFLFNE